MFARILVVTGALTGLYFFARGRAVCPVLDRIPVEQLTTDGVIHTIKRGWSAGGVDFHR